VFADRRAAGRVLAQQLHRCVDASAGDVVVLALPRGGVPVGYEIAVALGAPLDVFVVRKLGVTGHEELGMGAIASGGVRVLNADVMAELRITTTELDAVTAREAAELVRRELLYRGNRPLLDVRGRTVVLVDDGLATGASMRAGIHALRLLQPARIIGAVPVAASDVCRALGAEADAMVCAMTPPAFGSVGAWYADFTQTTDDEVRTLLARAAGKPPG
jgi:putative phosphoribosyl transferase